MFSQSANIDITYCLSLLPPNQNLLQSLRVYLLVWSVSVLFNYKHYGCLSWVISRK